MHPMSSRLTLQSRWDILKETIRIANSLRQKVEETVTIQPPSSLEPTIPEFTLPIPHESLAKIYALDIPKTLRESIVQLLHSRILQGQQGYIALYRRACLKSSHLGPSFDQDFGAILQMNKALYEKNYLPMVKELVSFVLAKVAELQKASDHGVKRPFNPEYTPFLEKYFEYNAYPSTLHQSVLAEKSMMTRRQIEVWFQNHRNRAKKDDAILRRNTSDLPLRVALNVLQENALCQPNRSTSPSEQDSLSDDMDDDNDDAQPTSCIDAFEKFRPQHAFPAVYPPSEPDPFPSDNGVIRFPPPTWARMPATSTPASMKAQASSVNVEDLARMFHMKLNIFEGTKKRAASKTLEAHSPWFAATTTIPSQAPHSASIRAPSRPSSTILPSSSSTFSFQFPVGSRSTSTANAFLSGPRQEAVTSRKISPLPRRVPASFNPIIASSLKQWSSRTSSFSSDHSSRSRSSSSSRGRTPEPTTPQLLTLDIPSVQDAEHVQQKPDEFDFSTVFDDDPHLSTTTSFDSLIIPRSINLTGDDQPPISLFNFNSLVAFSAPDYIPARS